VRHRPPDDPRQLAGRGDGRATPRIDDPARDAPGKAFFAVLEDHVGEILLVHVGQQVGGRRALRLIHPHVQRLVAPEAEPAPFRVELQGRHPQVRQHAVDEIQAPRIEDRAELAVIRVHELDAIAPGGERCGGERQRR
jgi:hypothetical protein